MERRKGQMMEFLDMFWNKVPQKQEKYYERLQKCSEERVEWPLTDSQIRMYSELIHEPENVVYNMPICCELPEGIDIKRFREAVKRAVARHPAFGMTIALSGGTFIMQLCHEYLEAVIEEYETWDIEEAKRNFVRSFRPGEEPFYHMELYHVRGRSYFLLDVHRIIFDEISAKVFLSEISLFYNGEEPESEKVSLMDLAVHMQTVKNTPEYQAAGRYFRERLLEVGEGEELPKDYAGELSGAKSFTVRMPLPDSLSCKAVEKFVQEKEIVESALFLGAFAYALGKYTGRDRSMFCTVHNGRHFERVAASVGRFVCTIPVYQNWEKTSTVEEYLRKVQENLYEVMRYDIFSFDEAVEMYGISTDILFLCREERTDGLLLDGRQYPAEFLSTGEIPANMVVMVVKRPCSYEISADYRKDVYSKKTAEELLRILAWTLEEMLIKGNDNSGGYFG